MDRLIVGITGASGTPLACRFVNQLKEFTECEVHVVASDSARLTAQYEAPDAFKKMLSCADVVHDNASIGGSIASGTFKTKGMVIIPCSMKTTAGIASCRCNPKRTTSACACSARNAYESYSLTQFKYLGSTSISINSSSNDDVLPSP